jgi:hypothetical protein
MNDRAVSAATTGLDIEIRMDFFPSTGLCATA